MGSIGPFQILIIAVVILVMFGRGRISEMMGDFGKGVASFKRGLSDEEKPALADSAQSTRLVALAPVAKPVGEPVESARAPDQTPG